VAFVLTLRPFYDEVGEQKYMFERLRAGRANIG